MKCYPIIGIVLRWFNMCHNDQCNSEEILIERNLKYFKPQNMPKLQKMDHESFGLSGIVFFNNYNDRSLDFEIANAMMCADIIRCAKPSEGDKLVNYFTSPGNIENKTTRLHDIINEFRGKEDPLMLFFAGSCAESLSGLENLKNAPKIVEAETGNEPFDIDAYFKQFETRLTQDERTKARKGADNEFEYRKELLDKYKEKHEDEWDVLFKFCARAIGGALGHAKYAQVLAARRGTFADVDKLLSQFGSENPKIRDILEIRPDCPTFLFFRPADPK